MPLARVRVPAPLHPLPRYEIVRGANDLHGWLFTFEIKATCVEVVVQVNHRVLRDPGAVHACFSRFPFEDGVAILKPAEASRLKAIIWGFR